MQQSRFLQYKMQACDINEHNYTYYISAPDLVYLTQHQSSGSLPQD
jgi:hypothetical protein